MIFMEMGINWKFIKCILITEFRLQNLELGKYF
jgi:hypothetical protein